MPSQLSHAGLKHVLAWAIDYMMTLKRVAVVGTLSLPFRNMALPHHLAGVLSRRVEAWNNSMRVFLSLHLSPGFRSLVCTVNMEELYRALGVKLKNMNRGSELLKHFCLCCLLVYVSLPMRVQV